MHVVLLFFDGYEDFVKQSGQCEDNKTRQTFVYFPIINEWIEHMPL